MNWSAAWAVLMLFLIPIGGGIPGGVLLARNRGLPWPVMMLLYLISDIILAFAFEPILWLIVQAGKRIAWLGRLADAMRKASKRAASVHTAAGPLGLIMIAFGVDPMTGRAAAAAAGHGFVSGWAIAITGDMMYFTLIMVSTLWLSSILGDGTWTTLGILAAMMIVPPLVKRVRERLKRQ